MGGVQPKVCALATLDEKPHSNKPKAIINPLKTRVLSDLREGGSSAALVSAPSLQFALPRCVCKKLINSPAIRQKS